MAEGAARGIARERRAVQDGADASAPPLLEREGAGGGGRGAAPRAVTPAEATGEDTQER